MATPKSRSAVVYPSAPEAPAGDRVVELSTLAAHDEWEDVRIVGADLARDRLQDLRLDRCELQQTVLTAAELLGLALVDVVAADCEMSGANLHEASFLRVELRNCRLAGIDLSGCHLRDVRFIDCKLDDANLRFVKAERMELVGCSLVDADFSESVLSDVIFDACDLTTAEFRKASMAGTRLAGSVLERVRGVASMRGAIVSRDQVIPLAMSLLGGVGLEIEEEEEEEA
ncbi:MAG: pentapeptide repeat-containing protein [Actinomycetia bacterium]|nr:pentapeptide repeat-containing protein [Actinomycetes bacterium]